MTQMLIPSHPITFNAPQGTSSLPLVEVPKSKVSPKHKPIRLRKDSQKRKQADCSFGKFSGALDFNAWQFFHAAKKTELASSFTPQQADRRAFAFALEHEDTFVWNTGNFRRIDRSIFDLEDFASSGFAGRVGEAIAYLTMVKWGYVFWDRCASVWARAAQQAHISHGEQLKVAQYLASRVASGRPQNEPDFVFEKPNGDVALMEAKGSFVDPDKDNPSTKDDLRQALRQLAAWSAVLSPTPRKSYGIGTYMREEHDANDDPSLIVFVDPPGESDPDVQPAELSADLVRRCNYGAWLAEMGFRQSGIALADRREIETTAIELPVVTLNGREFALSIQGWRIDQRRFEVFPWWPFEMMHFPWRHRFEFLREIGITGVYATGLEVSTLRAASAALADPASAALMDMQPTTDFGAGQGQQLDGFYGSVMPDGSLLGVVSSRYFDRELRLETFRL